MFCGTFESHVEVGQFFLVQDCLAHYMTSGVYDPCLLNASSILTFILQSKFLNASWSGIVTVQEPALH